MRRLPGWVTNRLLMTYKIVKNAGLGTLGKRAPGGRVGGRNLLESYEFLVNAAGFQGWLNAQSRREYRAAACVTLNGIRKSAKVDVALHELAIYALGQIVHVENAVKIVYGSLSVACLLPEVRDVARRAHVAVAQTLAKRLTPWFISFMAEKRAPIKIEKPVAERGNCRSVNGLAPAA